MTKLTNRIKKRFSSEQDAGFTVVEVLIAAVIFLGLLFLIGSYFVSAYKVTNIVTTSVYGEAEILTGSNKLVNQVTNTTEFVKAGPDFVHMRVVDDRGPNLDPYRQTVIYFYYDSNTTTSAKLAEIGIPSGVAVPAVSGLMEYRKTDPDSAGNQILPVSLTVLLPNITKPDSANPLFEYFALNNQALTATTVNSVNQLTQTNVNAIRRVQIHFETQPANRDTKLEINTSASPRWLGGGYADGGVPGEDPLVPAPAATNLACTPANSGNTTNAMTLGWSPITGASGYNIYKQNRKIGGSFILSSTVNGQTTSSYTDSDILPGEYYQYYVISWGPGGESAASNTTSCTSIPSRIPSLIADEQGSGATLQQNLNTITARFAKVSDEKVTRYEVQTRVNWASAGSSWQALTTINVAAASYEAASSTQSVDETNVALGDSRDYRARVCNDAGCSDWSTSTNQGTPADNDDNGLLRAPAPPTCSITSITTKNLTVRVNNAASSNAGNVIDTWQINGSNYTSNTQTFGYYYDNTTHSFTPATQNDRGWSRTGAACSGTTQTLLTPTCFMSRSSSYASANITVTASGGISGLRQVKVDWSDGWTTANSRTEWKTVAGTYYGYARGYDGYNTTGYNSCSISIANPPPYLGTCAATDWVANGKITATNTGESTWSRIDGRWCTNTTIDRWQVSSTYTWFDTSWHSGPGVITNNVAVSTGSYFITSPSGYGGVIRTNTNSSSAAPDPYYYYSVKSVTLGVYAYVWNGGWTNGGFATCGNTIGAPAWNSNAANVTCYAN